MSTLATTATEINRLHQEARASAESAVESAKAAGKLLLEAKASMKHGEFLPWIDANTSVSPRQAQRYMAAALGKSGSVRDVFPKSDMMSHLPRPLSRNSQGVWDGDHWKPEPGYLYCISADNGTYWVAPARNGGTHVSRLYSDDLMSTDGFTWRYTIFAENDDSDFTYRYYIGTRHAPLSRSGIHEILKSYGLHDIKAAEIKGVKCDDTLERPFGEPDPETWYWDSSFPDDGLYLTLKKNGLLNKRGVPI